MRLATRDNGTPDGELLVVSLDGTLALRAADWPNLLAAIGDWAAAGQELRRLADRIATGEGEPLDIATLRAPLPRTWQWLDGSAFQTHADLMQVALPAVGVMDMLRYHTFTAGAGWAYDYGTADDSKEMFDYLYGYSPVHNVEKGVAYPATLVTTGDHDDRVVPAHSFKFAAELQEKHAGNSPVLIRIETNAGHGAGTPVSKTIEQYADIFAFTLYNMGFEVLPEKVDAKVKG